MLQTPILDVLIGLSLFYLLLALICTTVSEMLASKLKTRSKFLDQGIDRLLSGATDLKNKLYNHPLINSLKPKDDQLPSYIPAEKFATALLDIVTGDDKKLTDVDAVRSTTAGNEDFRRALKTLVDMSPDAAALQKNVEEWFNSGMDRVTGWFKKNRQVYSLVLAAVITLFVNADTLAVVRTLWTNPTLRAEIVNQAAKEAQEPRPEGITYPDVDNPTDSAPIKAPASATEALSAEDQKVLGELTGWKSDLDKLQDKSGGDYWSTWCSIIWGHLLGWILTALAVSMGAPFWFDTLNRFMNIRNAGRAPDEPRDKSSKPAAQPPAAPPATPA